MPPLVIDLRKAEDTRDVVHRAVECLAEGRLVVFPTETVYGVGASARSEQGVEAIYKAKGRSFDAPLALAIKSAEEALDYVPNMSKLAYRLARRCWPGPVTLVVECDESQGLVSRLPVTVRRAVVSSGTLGLRVPAHQTCLDTMRMLAGPIALTSANRSGEPEAVTAKQIVDTFGDQVALVLDGGPCHYGQPSSVVKATENGLEILREGVVSKATLDRLASMMILFVCTGNTCRSPLAEAIMRRLLAEKFNCSADEVEQRGVIVASAGVAAVAGCGPTAEAVEAAKERGMELTQHESQPLTDKLVRHADVIFTLAGSHRQAILRRWPDAAGHVHLLRVDGGDVHDPIGGPVGVYRECAQQIENELKLRIEELDFS